MDLADYEWSQIKSYLEAVRPRLTGPESEETLVDIESHIHMAIKARLEAGEQGNLVAAVLAELDRPEQYGPLPKHPHRSGLSLYGLIGACLLPFAIPVIGHVAELTPLGDGSPMPAFYESDVYRFLLLPLGIIGPLVSMVLGWAGIQQCRRSRGVVYGVPLGVISLWGAPLIVLNLFGLVVFANTSPSIGFPIVMVLMLLVVFINVWVLRRVTAGALPKEHFVAEEL